MSQKIKIKQLTSSNELSGKVIKSDGLGGFDFGDVIEKGISFPIDPVSGDTYYRTDVDMLFYYDDLRSKWLSVNRESLSCGRDRLQKNTSAYYIIGNAVQSSTTGFNMPMNGTIVGVSIDNNNIVTNATGRILDIRVNNSTTNRYQLTIPNGSKSASSVNVDVDFSLGDKIQAILLSNNVDDFDNSIVIIEIAWRI